MFLSYLRAFFPSGQPITLFSYHPDYLISLGGNRRSKQWLGKKLYQKLNMKQVLF